MESKLYTIYDLLAEQYGPIFVATNDAVASRQFRALMQEMRVVNWDDYQLIAVGTWDDSIGELQRLESPNVVVVARPAQPNLSGFLVSEGN